MKAKDHKPSGRKKLKDYSSVPGTPPPERTKDKELASLEKELERERVYLTILERENNEIEGIIHDLDKELNNVRNNFPHSLEGDGKIHANNDLWFKYEAQMEVNRKLERDKRHLESEIKQMEEQGMINLDSLTQSELILYVKQLERTKTDLLSELRAKEWSLDKQAKDFHHLQETKRALEAEIKHYDGENALFTHYKRIACPSASASVSRQSSQKNSARRSRLPRQGVGVRFSDGKGLGKATSMSQENISTSSVGDVMFRSLEESKLRDSLKSRTTTPSKESDRSRRREDSKTTTDERKKKSSMGSLPELLPKRSKTPPTTTVTPAGKMVRRKCQRETSVSTEVDKSRKANAGIRVIVTDESDGTRTELTGSASSQGRTESGIGSPSEEYEDDFEESDREVLAGGCQVDTRRSRLGCATSRV